MWLICPTSTKFGRTWSRLARDVKMCLCSRLIKVKSARINLTLLNNNNNNDVFCIFCSFTIIKKKSHIFWNFKALLSFSFCFLSIRDSTLKNVH